MNKRINKKRNRQMLLLLLSIKVCELDKLITGRDSCAIYKVKNISVNKATAKVVYEFSDKHGLRIEIRSKEEGHNIPHFHVNVKDEGSASYSILDLSKLAGHIPQKTERIILEWARENRDILVKIWNDFHGYRVIAE